MDTVSGASPIAPPKQVAKSTAVKWTARVPGNSFCTSNRRYWTVKSLTPTVVAVARGCGSLPMQHRSTTEQIRRELHHDPWGVWKILAGSTLHHAQTGNSQCAPSSYWCSVALSWRQPADRSWIILWTLWRTSCISVLLPGNPVAGKSPSVCTFG